MSMLSQDVRRKFLEFFKKKGHALIPSSPVIPHDDPTLLFINAGMNQFKDVFLGKSTRDYLSATTTQKCIRVGGKHNDLENVGHTSRHLTFFEMLGNFSFGEYFKKETIAFAWEAALNVFCLEPRLIWATVYFEDEESFKLWKEFIPEKRIVRMGAKDNFWAMGDTGPCGPCSELLYDRGSGFGPARSPAEDITGERYFEFWNLVFMEFNRDTNGELHPLPKKCVDTGAGLERVVSLTTGAPTLFETDVLRSLIAKIEEITRISYDRKDPKAPAFHVIADHIRSLAFACADGVQPSNLDRGYVLRKILRRALRYGKQLGLERPFLASLLPELVRLMGDDFPELKTSEEKIAEVLTKEEESFLRTLRRGGNLMQQIVARAEKSGEISGDDAFKLKDTYGLPLEEIILFAQDAKLKIDLKRFEELERAAKALSKASRKIEKQVATESEFEEFASAGIFVGYHQLTAEAIVLGLWKGGRRATALHEGEEGMVLLDKTTFYAEKGGQVGDQGFISNQTAAFSVLDCQTPYPGVFLHHGVMQKGELHIGDEVNVTVDAVRRQKIANNHTATHLLHWALQQVLGQHVRQAGSVVEPKKLRFDFSHHKALTPEEIRQIESLVNAKIRENSSVRVYEIPYTEAQKHKEIQQFFGEKYGTSVRVVDIDYSKELCGGTHTQSVGTIGYFRIVRESSIAAGIRRIEALTGEEAEAFAIEKEETASLQASQLVKKLIEENDRLRKDFLKMQTRHLTSKVEMVGKIPFLGEVVDMDAKDLKNCSDLIMEHYPSLALFLIAKQEEKCMFLVRLSPDLVQTGLRADTLVRQIAALLEGKGGGKGDLAQGGGTELSKIPEAIDYARTWIRKTANS